MPPDSKEPIMVESANSISSVTVDNLSIVARNLLCVSLNSNKVFPTEGPNKLYRDWRGLAALVEVPVEVLQAYQETNKTDQILRTWLQLDSSPTIEKLFSYLEQIERFDVYDDLKELYDNNLLIGPTSHPPLLGNDKYLTRQDQEFDEPQYYHAYILFVDADRPFVEKLKKRLASHKFRLCTKDDLLIGVPTTYDPVLRLIKDRCSKLIAVYSPDFMQSSVMSYYINFAQALGIETKTSKIIPCMYRRCTLHDNLSYLHTLQYAEETADSSRYNFFWKKLAESLQMIDVTKAPMETTIERSTVSEQKPAQSKHKMSDFLSLLRPSKSVSLNNLDLHSAGPSFTSERSYFTDSSQRNMIESDTKKKKNPLKKVFNKLSNKKKKELVAA